MIYRPPPTLRRMMKADDFVRAVIGPVGSGKSSACIREIWGRASAQAPGDDGVRRTRFAIIRNTYSQLRDTTRKTFEQWYPPEVGRWHEAAFTFELEVEVEDGTRVHSEVLFRALDRPEDVKKLLSLELTGAYINEAREIPKHVLDVLETRVGRYPSKAQGGPTWFGVWMDTNPWHTGHWGYKLFSKQRLPGYALFEQPGGRSPDAENVDNLPAGYYDRLVHGKDSEWIASYVDGRYPSSDAGSIFGAWVAKLDARGDLCAFVHDTDAVFTSWDLGRGDTTAIWFWRFNEQSGVDVIDHYEARGYGLAHYFEVVDGKGYQYAKHWLPHDARQRTLATELTVYDQCAAHWPGKVDVVPSVSVKDGIAASRWLLEQKTRIHARCTENDGRLDWTGVEALSGYRYEWNDEDKTFSRDPVHDWASHSSDAFRYLALVSKASIVLATKPEPDRGPPAVSLAALPPLDDLWDTAPARRSR